MCVICDEGRVLDTREFTAPDYKGDDIQWMTYVYRKEEPISIPVGVTVTDISYTKTLSDGTFRTTFHGIPKFHQIGDDWYELVYETVEKTDWDENHG